MADLNIRETKYTRKIGANDGQQNLPCVKAMRSVNIIEYSIKIRVETRIPRK